MLYNFTGVQHLKSGDVTIPVSAFDNEDAYIAKYCHELEYAINNKDFNGLSVIVFTSDGDIAMNKKWIRKSVKIAPPEFSEE